MSSSVYKIAWCCALVRIAVFIAAIAPCAGENARIKFAVLDATDDGNVLFTSTCGECSTLFATNVLSQSRLLQPLDCYPQSIEALPDGKIRVKSIYTTATYDTNTATLSIPAADDISVKPLCLSGGAGNSRKWSPDGSYYVYAKGGGVYFCDPKAEAKGIQIAERYRYICRGTINSACWVSVNRSLFYGSSPKGLSGNDRASRTSALSYIEGDTIRIIEQNALYTHNLYSQMIGRGKVLGRLPYPFDSVRDKFSVRPDGGAVSVLKANALFSVYKVAPESASLLTSGANISLDTSKNVLEGVLMWGGEDAILWTTVLPWGGKRSTIVQSASLNGSTKVLMTEAAHSPVISPNGQKVAFFSNGIVRVCTTKSWKETGRYNAESIISAAWDGNYAMYLGGRSTVSRWIVGDKNAEVLFPSSVTSAAWSPWQKPSNEVTVSCPNGALFTLTISPQGLYWQRGAAQKPSPSNQISNRYRLFCAASPNNAFENALYVRELDGSARGGASPVTRPVSLSSVMSPSPKRRIALVLDAYTNAENLLPALLAIRSNGVKAAAFLNSAFIARYPTEVRAIADSGINTASLFFTDMDAARLGDAAHTDGTSLKAAPADSALIARCLARNEDEFLRVTGRELMPMWHDPHYKANDNVKKALEKAGYKYINALDISAQEGADMESAQDALSRLLSALDATDANIVAIPIGSVLCKEMDYLIASLQDARYQIVAIEEL